MTHTDAITTAQRWLERQKATNRIDDCLDEGDCRTCGHPAGEGHEPTDPCGIIAGLLAALDAAKAEALEQAAIAYEAHNRYGKGFSDWLRARAAALRTETQG